MKKIGYYIILLLFTSFGLMQLNDPDWWLWIWPYFLVSFLAVLKLKNRTIPYLSVAGIFLISIWFILYIPDLLNWLRGGMPNIANSMKAESPYIELVRESLGLLLILIALIFLAERKDLQK